MFRGCICQWFIFHLVQSPSYVPTQICSALIISVIWIYPITLYARLGNVLGAVEHWSITFDFLLHQLFCLSCMWLLHLGWPFILWSIRFLSSYQCEVLCIYCTCFVFTRYSLLTLVSEAICHLIYPFRWQVSI